MRITINAHDGLQEIAQNLKEHGVIRSVQIFKVYSFIFGAAHTLKPGVYFLNSASTTRQIVSELKKGPKILEVTVIEGETIGEIDEKLSALGIFAPGELVNFPLKSLAADFPFLQGVNSLEGFLFPDTYRFFSGAGSEVVLRVFLEGFAKHVSLLLDVEKKFDYNRLIIASFLEKEAADASDRAIIAGIIYKRLAHRMPLQIDATVLFTVCGGRFHGCKGLTRGDFKVDSLFNTYTKTGLTPTPIANPGEVSLYAAKNPKVSAFFYYLSDPGTHKIIFSRTLEEHNNNRARYLGL